MFGLTTIATFAAAALVVPVAAKASAVDAAASALRDSVAGSDDFFVVDFVTDVTLDDGSAAVISVNITNSWAPLGAAHFRELVEVSVSRCRYSRVTGVVLAAPWRVSVGECHNAVQGSNGGMVFHADFNCLLGWLVVVDVLFGWPGQVLRRGGVLPRRAELCRAVWHRWRAGRKHKVEEGDQGEQWLLTFRCCLAAHTFLLALLLMWTRCATAGRPRRGIQHCGNHHVRDRRGQHPYHTVVHQLQRQFIPRQARLRPHRCVISVMLPVAFAPRAHTVSCRLGDFVLHCARDCWLSGTVIAGMDVANAVFNPTPSSSGGISQSDYTQKGNSWLKKNYPETNFIVNASIRQ